MGNISLLRRGKSPDPLDISRQSTNPPIQVNACFIPVIYLYYPETRRRSLEEIDLIFAKGYLENISYVKASFDLPYLTDQEVEAMSREYGFVGEDEEKVGELSEKIVGTEGAVSSGRHSSSGNSLTTGGLRND